MKKRKKGARSPWPIALVFRLVLIISALALLISYISIYINPSLTSVPLFFGLYFIPLVMLNVFLLIVGLIRRSGATWITFIILLPSILFADLFVRWGKPNEGEKGIALKVCTYNVGLFAQDKKHGRQELLTSVAGFITKEQPEVVCFQEFYINDTADIRKTFTDYPYIFYHFFSPRVGGKFGNLTLSKFPIVSSGKIIFKGSTNLCIYTDIEHFGKKIRLYNTHLESHSISFTSLIKKMSKSDKVSEDIFDMHDKMASTFKKRALQVDSIASHASGSEYPAIFCGDFNDTPMSYTYHNLTIDKQDSFRESGKGFSATYSYMWPLLRIDYILYPRYFWSMSHKTERISFSDHYPVISVIIIP
ncbi:MAG: endonuclease/exonuclease/phosphatase family protein [Bacteroidales bacterium]|jgi:endonuclease/exonuclease/phosphatase family metal-dependent hydrolase